MKRRTAIVLGTVLLGAGCYLLLLGYRNQVLFEKSRGYHEVPIRLDRIGAFSLAVDPPGRSLFWPGGLLEIVVDGPEAGDDFLTNGKATVTVTDRAGKTCLSEDSSIWTVSHSADGSMWMRALKEFDTSAGGPYGVQFEVTAPFTSMAGRAQSLRVRHFVCGNEVMLHWIPYTSSGLLFASAGLAGFRARKHGSRQQAVRESAE